ncbi:MAG: hypothetical protein AAF108_00625 [Planctomycetota bacterium]
MKIRALLATALLTPALGGCVVWDIKDNLVSINEKLGEIDERLVQLESDLEPLPELTKLAELEAINESIDPIEKHLASLRKTIASIDSTVPFLNFTDDTEESVEEESAEGEPEPAAADD